MLLVCPAANDILLNMKYKGETVILTELSSESSLSKYNHQVWWCDEVESTMTKAVEFLKGEKNKDTDFTILAGMQTKGRGRAKKSFISPDGGYYGTTVLNADNLRCGSLGLSLVVGVVLCRTLLDFTGVPLKLKWPNDIFTQQGEKLAGILIEQCSYAERKRVLIGVGVNLSEPPSIAGVKVASLSTLSVSSCTPQHFARYFLAHLLAAWEIFVESGLREFIMDWRKYAYGLGSSVSLRDGSCTNTLTGKTHVLEGEQIFSGDMLGIDEQGYLLIDSMDGVFKVISGDVLYHI